MSLAFAIALIVTFDVALLAALAFAMAQARHLRPHVHPHLARLPRPHELRPRSERKQDEQSAIAA